MKSHRVLVFHKLESFRGAAANVKSLLEDLKLEDVVINDYSASYSRWAPIEFTTVVVVIDARQTRTLITPERRDANVDHWAELNDIWNNVTKSILLVVYGDEQSKFLEENKTIARSWMTTWKFNDENAYKLAKKKRCFTIWNSFNGAQKSEIQNFIRLSSSLPTIDYDSSVLLLGNDGGAFDKYARDHPLIDSVDEKGDFGEIIKYNYANINYNYKRQPTNVPKAQLFIDKAFPMINVCQTRNSTESIRRQLSAASLKGVMKRHPPCFRRSRREDSLFDRAVLTCHCKECYSIINENRAVTRNILKDELDTVGVTLDGDVFPWLPDDHESCANDMDSTIKEMRQVPFGNDEKVPGDAIVKLYAWHILLYFSSRPLQSGTRIKDYVEFVIEKARQHKKLLLLLLVIAIISWYRLIRVDECKKIQWQVTYDPICGSDRVTYMNKCLMRSIAFQFEVDIFRVHDGICKDTSDGCKQLQCEDKPAPVCGSDGVTYNNKCQLRLIACQYKTEISVVSQGVCKETHEICKQIVCVAELQQVCGSDGVTYINKCQLRLAACHDEDVLSLIHDGACKDTPDECKELQCGDKPAPVCGSDGVTYNNKCQLRLIACQYEIEIYVVSYGVCIETTHACKQIECEHKLEGQVCGSDGLTYNNKCELRVAACLTQVHNQSGVSLVHAGACKDTRDSNEAQQEKPSPAEGG
ncbi:uncharacterized protein [Ptychodera flava]|uniref:uncharacterized protein isoform X2 n=1 Tax=Ptychodera flava TaxID=63121 RepID=UPI00396A6474